MKALLGITEIFNMGSEVNIAMDLSLDIDFVFDLGHFIFAFTLVYIVFILFWYSYAIQGLLSQDISFYGLMTELNFVFKHNSILEL